MNDLKAFYDNDERFKRYVDRYCNEFQLTVNEALQHALVKETAEYYLETDKDKKEEKQEVSETNIVAGCGGAATEDESWNK